MRNWWAKPSRPIREQVVIATKFGWELEPGRGPLERFEQPAGAHQAWWPRNRSGGSRSDAIDLYYQHRVDPKVPIEDVAGAVKDLIQEGKVKHFGLSEASWGNHPPGAHGAACGRAAERVFAMVGESRAGDPASARRARDRICAIQSPRKRVSHRKDQRIHEVRAEDIPNTVPRFQPEERKANQRS